MDFDSFGIRQSGSSIERAKPDEITREFRHCLWNLVYRPIFAAGKTKTDLMREIYENLHLPLDEVPVHHTRQVELPKASLIGNVVGHQAYDLFERVMFHFSKGVTPERFTDNYRETTSDNANAELRRAGAPYHIVDYRLTPVQSEQEIAEIESAVNLPDKYAGARTQLRSAIVALSNRPDPKIRECVNESITAVESTLKVTTSGKSGGVSAQLKKLGDEHDVHKALQTSIASLYGFTSDQEGLRHPMITEDKTDTADARMLLVASSALVNWIVAKDAELCD